MTLQQKLVNALEAAGDWTDEAELIGSHDNTCMSSTTKNDVSGEFSFAFTTPTGTIDGIMVAITRSYGDTDDYITVELYDATSTWRAKNVSIDPGGPRSCADGIAGSVGGGTDKWGGTWTAAHIKSTDFRMRVTAKATGGSGDQWYCDNAIVSVWYTEAAATKVMVID